MRKYILSLVALVALVAVHAAFAGPVPNPGISQARAPLARSGSTVYLTTNGVVRASRVSATFGTFGNMTITGSCVGCGGGGGGGGGAISSWSSVSRAQTRVTTTWDGSVPPPASSGTILSSLVVPTTAGHRYQVRGLATLDNDNGGATNIAVWLATNGQPARAMSVHVLSASFSGTVPVEWIDTSAGGSITFQLYGAGDNSNGANFISNQAQFGGTKTGWAAASDTGIYIIDLDSGGGGGGGGGSISDPITVNGWTPAGGTASVTGTESVSGAISAASASISGSETVGGNSTISGIVTGNIVVSAGGAFETPAGFPIELIPPIGHAVVIETSGTRPSCTQTTEASLWYAHGNTIGSSALSACVCSGLNPFPSCSWVNVATH